MAEVTLQQEEYELLKRQAAAYKRLMAGFFTSMAPSSVDEIVSDFKATGLYPDEFITDLESGLRRSSLSHNK